MTPEQEDMYWLAATVLQEAGGEPYTGKLGVAWAIVNRTRVKGIRVPDVVLAPWQFSCWNTASCTKKLITHRQEVTWSECERAAEAAYKALEPDPTHGSTHYLRPETVIAASGKLPSWYHPNLVRAELGHHKFLQVPF